MNNKTESDLETLFITKEEQGERLDKILAERYRNVQSRTYFQKLIEDQLVLLNGIPVKKRARPQEGDEVEVQFLLVPEISLEPEDIPFAILYEDEHLIAINKPAGLVVHPAPGHWKGTFVNGLLFHCQKQGVALSSLDKTHRPGIVHRLDKDTTGVLVAAKTTQAHQKLVELFSTRQVHKEYLAICIGNPGRGTVDAPIARHPTDRKKMAIVPEGGRPAMSHYVTEALDKELSLVRIQLVTGRTHQARVHLKHLGCPVLGDPTYGSVRANERFRVLRQMLHAEVLKFAHPMTGTTLWLKAPPPPDLQQWIDRLTKKHGLKESSSKF